jgi:hypothetical protein
MTQKNHSGQRDFFEPIHVRSVRLVRLDGPARAQGQERVLQSLPAANGILQGWATSAPADGRYNAIEYEVTWEDGQVFRGQYPLVHISKAVPNLADHARHRVAYLAGLERPGNMTTERYDEALANVGLHLRAWARDLVERHELIPGTPSARPSAS